MKILLLTHQGGMSGATHSIFYLSDGLARRGHQVWVGCPSDSLLAHLLEKSPARQVPITIRGRFDIRAMWQIRDLVQQHQIEIINAQSCYDRFTSMLAKWFFRLPVKLFHTRRETPTEPRFLMLNWLVTRLTDRVIAVSPGVKESLEGLGMRADHIQVINNGTPASKYRLADLAEKTAAIQLRYGLAKGIPVIGCVARQKQQNQLIAAMEFVDTPPCTVMFVGIPGSREYEEQIRRQRNGHRYIFTGPVEVADVLYFYPLFAMNVLPSVTEGLSQALLEAMAMGVPVVATDAAGNSDLIRHNENGLLFADGDIEELARQIKGLLQNPEKGRALAASGKTSAFEDYSIERTLDQYEAFFQDCFPVASSESGKRIARLV